MPDAAKPPTNLELAAVFHRMFHAAWILCKAHGLEKELLRDNLPAIRQHWADPRVRKTYEHARQLGVTK